MLRWPILRPDPDHVLSMWQAVLLDHPLHGLVFKHYHAPSSHGLTYAANLYLAQCCPLSLGLGNAADCALLNVGQHHSEGRETTS